MAKAEEKKKGSEFPSAFGSHRSMVDKEATAALNDPTKVVVVDEFGPYETEANRLDSGIADPNRYSQGRLEKVGMFSNKKGHADKD